VPKRPEQMLETPVGDDDVTLKNARDQNKSIADHHVAFPSAKGKHQNPEGKQVPLSFSQKVATGMMREIAIPQRQKNGSPRVAESVSSAKKGPASPHEVRFRKRDGVQGAEAPRFHREFPDRCGLSTGEKGVGRGGGAKKPAAAGPPSGKRDCHEEGRVGMNFGRTRP